MNNQLDPQVLNLTKAIRQVESQGNFQAVGKSGEYGAYQFTEPTWKALSSKYLGSSVPLQSATPEQQNEVAYKHIADLKASGKNVAQIAAIWNHGTDKGWENAVGTNDYGVAYDVPAYVNKVATTYHALKSATPPSVIPDANASTGPNISTPNQGPSVSGFIGNVFKSAGGVVGGLASAVMHPVKTVENVAGMAAGGIEKAFGAEPNEDTQKFDALVGYMKERYGGDSLGEVMKHIANTAYTDPVGVALDLSTIVDGIGAAVGAVGKTAKVAELSKAAEAIRGASEIINPIAGGARATGVAANKVGQVAKFAASQMIGLNKAEDVSNVINNYQKFSKAGMEAMSRENLADDVFNAGQQLESAMQHGGAAYGGVVSANAGREVVMPENWIKDVLGKGTSVSEDGSKAIPFKLNIVDDPATGGMKVVADTKSFTRNPSDIAAIQNFVNNWGGKSTMSAEEFLNMRQDLSQLSKFGKDVGRNDAAELVAKALRADANKTMRPQIKGLQERDELQAPLINQWNQFKKDFLKPNESGQGYVFKDGAVNKIANSIGKGKSELLNRLERIAPGITQRLQLMKTVESIESAYGLKVGTYAKSIVGGASLLSGNVPGIIAAIVSHPDIAIPLLRGLGWSKAKVAPILEFLRTYINSKSLRYPTEVNKIVNNNDIIKSNK